MADITEIQLKIKAVEFALKSFARFSDEQQRRDPLRSQFDNVQKLVVTLLQLIALLSRMPF
jgi:hypothetical protein